MLILLLVTVYARLGVDWGMLDCRFGHPLRYVYGVGCSWGHSEIRILTLFTVCVCSWVLIGTLQSAFLKRITVYVSAVLKRTIKFVE